MRFAWLTVLAGLASTLLAAARFPSTTADRQGLRPSSAWLDAAASQVPGLGVGAEWRSRSWSSRSDILPGG
jgi:hypothetical protein